VFERPPVRAAIEEHAKHTRERDATPIDFSKEPVDLRQIVMRHDLREEVVTREVLIFQK
jgi:hypothetical protein